MVERHFESDNKEELWKACRTSINKSTRNNEIKSGLNVINYSEKEEVSLNSSFHSELGPGLSIVNLNENNIIDSN